MPNSNRPMTDPAQIELGAQYRDILSGLEGVAQAHVRYITGCDQVDIKPEMKQGDHTRIPDGIYIDFIRLVKTGGRSPEIKSMLEHMARSSQAEVAAATSPVPATGGPQEAPPSRA